MKSVFMCLAVLFVLFGLKCAVNADEIRVGGGGAALDGIIKPVKEPFEKASGITLKLLYSNDILSYKNLLADTVDASTFGGSFDEFEILAKKNGASFPKQSDYCGITDWESSYPHYCTQEQSCKKPYKRATQRYIHR